MNHHHIVSASNVLHIGHGSDLPRQRPAPHDEGPSSSPDVGDPMSPASLGVHVSGNTLTLSQRLGPRTTHVCSVCGDRAFYVFYGALACDSCRTFFRRQVLQGKTLTCHFKNHCTIQMNTRKDCAKCRLEKCLRVGMKQTLVAVNEAGGGDGGSSGKGGRGSKAAYSPMMDTGHYLTPSPTPPSFSSVSGQHHQRDSPASRIFLACRPAPQSQPAVPLQHFNDHLSQHHDDLISSTFKESVDKCANEPRSSGGSPRPAGVERPRVPPASHAGIDKRAPVLCTDSKCPCAPQQSQQHIAKGPSPPSPPYQPSSNVLKRLQDGDHLHRFQEYEAVRGRTQSLDQDSGAPWADSSVPKSYAEYRSLSTDTQQSPPPVPQPGHPTREVLETMGDDGAHDDEGGSGRSPPPLGTTIEYEKLKEWRLRSRFHKRPGMPYKVDTVHGTVFMASLNENERSKMDELCNATATLSRRDAGSELIVSEDRPQCDFINLMYMATYRLISMTRAYRKFGSLPPPDQMTLLKGAISEMLFLWSVCSLDEAQRTWVLPCFQSPLDEKPPRVSVDVLKAAKDGLEMYVTYRNFVESFEEFWRKDHFLLNLLSVICLFNPEREDLIDKEDVRYERRLYSSLFKRYIEAAYATVGRDQPDAQAAFDLLSSKLEELSKLKQLYERTEVNMDEVGRLGQPMTTLLISTRE